MFSLTEESLKGKPCQKVSKSRTKEREKCETTSHNWPQCAKWLSRYRILKSGIWARWTTPFCRFLASFSLYDVTDAILQDSEKTKVQYLRNFLFDLFEILQAVRTWKKFTCFKFRCYGNQNQNDCLLLKKRKGLLFKERGFSKIIWKIQFDYYCRLYNFLKKN